jgi:hypothetical protein
MMLNEHQSPSSLSSSNETLSTRNDDHVETTATKLTNSAVRIHDISQRIESEIQSLENLICKLNEQDLLLTSIAKSINTLASRTHNLMKTSEILQSLDTMEIVDASTSTMLLTEQ